MKSLVVLVLSAAIVLAADCAADNITVTNNIKEHHDPAPHNHTGDHDVLHPSHAHSSKEECYDQHHPHPKFDFKCSDETAIHLSQKQVCDGDPDCPDGSDETLEACLQANKCPFAQHKCLNESLCLPHEKLCDGTMDCANGWDETEFAGCPLKHMLSRNETGFCPEQYSACDSPFTRCIPDHAKCNFRRDCDNGEDEEGCTERKCPRGYFHCYKTGDEELRFYVHCIAIDHVCDHVPNCPNQEDESESACDLFQAHFGHSDNDGSHHHHNVDKGLDKQLAISQKAVSTGSLPSHAISTLFLIAGLVCILY